MGKKSVGTTELKHSTKKQQYFSHTESFFSFETRQSMKRRIATERLSKMYIARCGYTWLDESKWPQEWPISPITIIWSLTMDSTDAILEKISDLLLHYVSV